MANDLLRGFPMHSMTMVGGEGASTPVISTGVFSLPALVVCPAIVPSTMTFESLQEIYLAAYERALAALRPARYELANRFVAN
jgi:hypothetical protein